jgi:hypothetical protein
LRQERSFIDNLQRNIFGLATKEASQPSMIETSRATASAVPPIVLKKSLLGDGQKFLGPLTRFARGDVRDHIVSHKNDHRPSYRR